MGDMADYINQENGEDDWYDRAEWIAQKQTRTTTKRKQCPLYGDVDRFRKEAE